MGANSGIYLGPLSPIEQGKPFHEGPPLLVGSGTFGVDRVRGAQHGMEMRKPYAGFCPMRWDHAHSYRGWGTDCSDCGWDMIAEAMRKEELEATQSKTLTASVRDLGAAVDDFKASVVKETGINPDKICRAINNIITAKPNPDAVNIIQR